MIKKFDEAVDFMYTTVPKTKAASFGGGKAFEKSKRFFERLDNIQNDRPAIHIAATSGKGTVAYMIEHILEAHGLKTATLTSPHVYKITERTRINGRPLFDEEFVKYLNALLPHYKSLKKGKDAPTYFEMNLAIGFFAAADYEVDCCIVETGLGGALDTSNTIKRDDKINIIGQIGFDHTHILGNTLEDIAAQKTGIIQRGQEVIALNQKPLVNQVIERAIKQKSAHLNWVDADKTRKQHPNLSSLNQVLAGSHQYSNLALAQEACRIYLKRQGLDIDNDKVRDGVSRVELPGRFEILNISEKTIVLDGAHNEQKLTAVFEAMTENFGEIPYGVVFACGQKEQAKELALKAQHIAAEVILTEYHSEALDMYKPAYNFRRFAADQNVRHSSSHQKIAADIMSSATDIWLITGSFYILGDLKKALSAN